MLNKPAGLAVQGGAGIKTSLDSILSAERELRPLLVHRLDKETSGVILTAKSAQAARYFSGIMAGHETIKRYTALCALLRAENLPDSGKIDSGLSYKKGRRSITKNKIAGNKIAENKINKSARTNYKIIEKIKKDDGLYARFELELETGRTHQIRRHLAALGCPVLGDGLYGDFALNKKLRAEHGLKHMLLHASTLIITLPSGKTLELNAPLPDYFNIF